MFLKKKKASLAQQTEGKHFRDAFWCNAGPRDRTLAQPGNSFREPVDCPAAFQLLH